MKKFTEVEWRRKKGRHPTVQLIGRYEGSQVPLLVRCRVCGREWKSTPGNLLKGKRCRVCSWEQAALTLRKTKRNKVLSEIGGVVTIDISTKAYPGARMTTDSASWARLRRLNSRISSFGRYAVYYTKGGRANLVHRFLAGQAKYIDHIDGNGLNNQASNLRRCTASENGSNRTKLNKNNTSGVPGVRRRADTRRWSAHIMVDRKTISLGCCDTLEEALALRKAAERKYFKSFAPKAQT